MAALVPDDVAPLSFLPDPLARLLAHQLCAKVVSEMNTQILSNQSFTTEEEKSMSEKERNEWNLSIDSIRIVQSFEIDCPGCGRTIVGESSDEVSGEIYCTCGDYLWVYD
jgi:hypothetical protein